MAQINIAVQSEVLFFENTPVIPSESSGEHSIVFNFLNSDWEDYTKYCVFISPDGAEQSIPVLINTTSPSFRLISQQVTIPDLFLKKRYFYIGLCGIQSGTSKKKTTTLLLYEVEKGRFLIGETPEEGEPISNQILATYNDIVAKLITLQSFLNNSPINVKEFGATGEGEVDDVVAIQTALELCHSNGGGTVFFPRGTYLIGTGLGKNVRGEERYLEFYSNTRILGEPGTVLKFHPDLADILNINTSTMIQPISLLRNRTETGVGTESGTPVGGYEATSNVQIENITFDCNDQFIKKVTAVGIGHARDVVIKNCKWLNGRATNTNHVHYLEINGSKNVKVIDCSFEPIITPIKNNASYGNDCEMINVDPATRGSYGHDTYYKWDNTISDNIEIEGCIFKSYNYSDKFGVDILIPDQPNTPYQEEAYLSPAIGTHPPATTRTTNLLKIHDCTFLGDWCRTSDEHVNWVIRFYGINTNARIYDNVFYASPKTSGQKSPCGICIQRGGPTNFVYNNTFYNYDNDYLVDTHFSERIAYNNYCYSNLTNSVNFDTQTFNVKKFGAAGNGEEDDSLAIQNAINYCSQNGGGTVYFPNGIYYLSKSLMFSSNIKLQGDTNTIFTAEPTISLIERGYKLRNSVFLEIGTPGNTHAYEGFSNVEINSIIFDLGGQWSLNGEGLNTILTYKAKYNAENEQFNGFYSYCPIIACHGDGLKIINCTFKNGVYGGYTGNAGTNPHVMDLGGVKNLLIEDCSFGPMFVTSTAISNWHGGNSSDTGQPDPNACDLIQMDAAYGDGGGSDIKGALDGTICRDVIIRKNKFYGLPPYDWKRVINNSGDNDKLIIKPEVTVGSNQYGINFAQWRFGKYPAIGTCHEYRHPEYQPQNVQVYDNIFENSWPSHYCGSNAMRQESLQNALQENSKDDAGNLYPVIDNKWEPARKFCSGAIYAYPGAKEYNIYNNLFKESLPCAENKSTGVFLYGSLAGIVHDNTFIEYGEPLPFGKKTENMAGFTFDAEDEWKANYGSGTNPIYYNGLSYCNSSNNVWIRNDKAYNELNYYESFFDVKEFGAKGDGKTDDGWAIQTAIDRCRDCGGGTVHFPKGVYNVTRALLYYSNMTFKFEEGAIIRPMTGTIINAAGETVINSRTPSLLFAPYFDTKISYLSHKTETSGFAANRYGVENVVFDGGTISGKSYDYNNDEKKWEEGRHNAMVELCLCRNVKISNMTFDNCNEKGGHAIEINSSTDVIVEKSRFIGVKNSTTTNGTRQEYLQIDSATCFGIGSQVTITHHKDKYISPSGISHENWYSYTAKTSNLGIIFGYFDFTLLAPGGMYQGDDIQDAITEKIVGRSLNVEEKVAEEEKIRKERGFHQCCHNIEIKNCYFEKAKEDKVCAISAIGNHTDFKGNGDYDKATDLSGTPAHSDKYYERYANFDQDKTSGIKIHGNTFVWPSNKIEDSTAKEYWRGVIAFGYYNGKWYNTHVNNVAIYGNMFYRDKESLYSSEEIKEGYAITAVRSGIRCTEQHEQFPQSKYRIYGNFYAGLNGWEDNVEKATSTGITKNGNILLIVEGVNIIPSEEDNSLTIGM